MAWIKMINPTTPEDSGGGVPRIIEHPDKVVLPGNILLSDLTKAEAAGFGWFECAVASRPDERVYNVDSITYATDVNLLVTQTINTSLRPRADIVRQRVRDVDNIMWHRTQNAFVFQGAAYPADDRRYAQVGLLATASWTGTVAIRRTDGTWDEMDKARFTLYANAMAAHFQAVRARRKQILDGFAVSSRQALADLDANAVF